MTLNEQFESMHLEEEPTKTPKGGKHKKNKQGEWATEFNGFILDGDSAFDLPLESPVVIESHPSSLHSSFADIRELATIPASISNFKGTQNAAQKIEEMNDAQPEKPSKFTKPITPVEEIDENELEQELRRLQVIEERKRLRKEKRATQKRKSLLQTRTEPNTNGLFSPHSIDSTSSNLSGTRSCPSWNSPRGSASPSQVPLSTGHHPSLKESWERLVDSDRNTSTHKLLDRTPFANTIYLGPTSKTSDNSPSRFIGTRKLTEPGDFEIDDESAVVEDQITPSTNPFLRLPDNPPQPPKQPLISPNSMPSPGLSFAYEQKTFLLPTGIQPHRYAFPTLDSDTPLTASEHLVFTEITPLTYAGKESSQTRWGTDNESPFRPVQVVEEGENEEKGREREGEGSVGEGRNEETWKDREVHPAMEEGQIDQSRSVVVVQVMDEAEAEKDVLKEEEELKREEDRQMKEEETRTSMNEEEMETEGINKEEEEQVRRQEEERKTTEEDERREREEEEHEATRKEEEEGREKIQREKEEKERAKKAEAEQERKEEEERKQKEEAERRRQEEEEFARKQEQERHEREEERIKKEDERIAREKAEEEERHRKEKKEEEERWKEQERARREEEEKLKAIAKAKQEAEENHRKDEERQERARLKEEAKMREEEQRKKQQEMERRLKEERRKEETTREEEETRKREEEKKKGDTKLKEERALAEQKRVDEERKLNENKLKVDEARRHEEERRKEEERLAEEANRRKRDEKEEEERRRKKEEWRRDVQLKEEDLRKDDARQRTKAQEKTTLDTALHHSSHDRTDTARRSEDEDDSDSTPEPNSHIPIPTSPLAEHSPLNKADHLHHRRALHPATVPLPSPPKHAPAACLNQETRNRSQSAQPRSTRTKEAGRRKEENSQDKKSGSSTPLTTTVTPSPQSVTRQSSRPSSVLHVREKPALEHPQSHTTPTTPSKSRTIQTRSPLTANALASRQRKEEQKRIAEAAERARERVRRKKQEERAERKAVEEAQRREKEKMNSQIQLQRRIVEKNIDTMRRVEQIGEERRKDEETEKQSGSHEHTQDTPTPSSLISKTEPLPPPKLHPNTPHPHPQVHSTTSPHSRTSSLTSNTSPTLTLPETKRECFEREYQTRHAQQHEKESQGRRREDAERRRKPRPIKAESIRILADFIGVDQLAYAKREYGVRGRRENDNDKTPEKGRRRTEGGKNG
ncbi:hypothetical protein BLNAU_9025 [Blattamonas nauphoetae]|uniref:Uncharacterized protein n=1 Tax=Blattamonas nauphoetae TaxID=2049346 RepID=A0ABQ9XX44_9EUKA|nr:hypothetical protein BLNAU_9025 [Blattamonas nauphoetae]